MWLNRAKLYKKLRRLNIRNSGRTKDRIRIMWGFRKFVDHAQFRKRMGSLVVYTKFSSLVADGREMAFRLWLSNVRRQRVRKTNSQLFKYYEKLIALKRAFRAWDLRVCHRWTIAHAKRIDHEHFLTCTYRRVFRRLKFLVVTKVDHYSD
jgi:hypothetical protein